MGRVARRVLLVVLATSALTACGFHPVYGPAADAANSPAAQALAQISVGLIPERSGQMLRLALQERFERGGVAPAKRYDLTVGFGISSEAISIQQNSAASWVRMVGTATYSLISQDPGRATLTYGAARVEDGYNLFDQQYFASDLGSEAAQRRIAQAVADQIALRLAGFLAKRAATPAGGSG